MNALAQQILGGLTTGLVYALLALGFSAVYQSMRLINFAQGDLFMAGSFIGYLLATKLHLSFLPVLALTLVICFALGVTVERLALAPRSANASEVNLMIRTIGVSVFLQGAALLLFGTEEYRFPDLLSGEPILVGGLVVPRSLEIVGAASLGLMLLLWAFLKNTRTGTAMRAASQDRAGAEMIGIDVARMRSLAYGISAALAGGGGVLIGPLWYVHQSMGVMMGLKGFTAAVIGGLGSMPGAIVGGICLGVIENLSTGYLSSTWKDAIVFAILLAMLSLRPDGIFRTRSAERA
jgi:branched-chain amino acid transport system permease protein